MTLLVLPDTLLLVRNYLAGVSELAALVGTRIAVASPQDTTTPWVRLTRVGGHNGAYMRLDTANIQIDAFAPVDPDGVAVAMRVARTVYAALHGALGYVGAEGVICDVQDLSGLAYEPDEDYTPPFPRVLLSVAVTSHIAEVSP